MELYAVAVVLLALITIKFKMMMPFGYAGVVQDERKCQYFRPSRMLKIRCFDMNLKEVPQFLKSSVEILDLAFNRIKKLKHNSFERYTSIKILVLYENKIQSVEPGTFAPLTSMEEIDLSNNALVTIPLEIFQLPSLRNLYVDSNELFNLERDLQGLDTPIQAPLEYLNVADCGLESLPNLGVLPKLWQINASSNPLTELTMDTLANMCNLRTMDLTKTEINDCACQQVNRYLRYVGASAKFVPICMDIVCFFAAKGKWPFIPSFMQPRVDEAARTFFKYNDSYIQQFCQKFIQIKECFRPIFGSNSFNDVDQFGSVKSTPCTCANEPIIYFDRDHIGNVGKDTILNTIEFLENFLEAPPPTPTKRRKNNRVRSRLDEIDIE
ncbi:decorin isoform X2 [Eurosta solidaginis]|uniref:decorin isoform X2 n=1 Tax=Eurosta solidaginis TaxID=178769 RepID=UPI0035317BE0